LSSARCARLTRASPLVPSSESVSRTTVYPGWNLTVIRPARRPATDPSPFRMSGEDAPAWSIHHLMKELPRPSQSRPKSLSNCLRNLSQTLRILPNCPHLLASQSRLRGCPHASARNNFQKNDNKDVIQTQYLLSLFKWSPDEVAKSHRTLKSRETSNEQRGYNDKRHSNSS
jgi:hypothetical protein